MSKPIPKKLKIWAWIIKPLRRQIAWKVLRKAIVKSIDYYDQGIIFDHLTCLYVTSPILEDVRTKL